MNLGGRLFLLLILRAVLPYGIRAFSFVATPFAAGRRGYLSNTIHARGEALCANQNDGSTGSEALAYLNDVLEDYGWDNRLVTLSSNRLPVLAEVQRDGQILVGRIVELEDPDQKGSPKVIMEPVEQRSNSTPTTFGVDLGQLTTVWVESMGLEDDLWEDLCELSGEDTEAIDAVPLRRVDEILNELYDKASEQQQQSNKRRRHSWTKKELNRKIENLPITNGDDGKEATILESVLRQIFKGGPNHERLVDSKMTADFLWKNSQKRERFPSFVISCLQRAKAAGILDKQGGGRFKRMPCHALLPNFSTTGGVTLLNGGWLAVDSAVRAASEARQLAKEGTSRGTQADERIVQCLEDLAMSKNRNSHRRRNQVDEEQNLEMGLREFLKAMHLPLTPEGAREALVKMGLWSSTDEYEDSRSNQPQPWSPEVLQAVKWYQQMDEKRRTRLVQSPLPDKETKVSKKFNAGLEGRIDLRHLPCVCVDAARTSFRDDAIGVRPRSSTGRKVSSASKWEILIHIADVSDLYAADIVRRSEHLEVLQRAAASRGASRYDLASGPLHLLPPSLLETLSLRTVNPDFTCQTGVLSSDQFRKIDTVNRCVTLWVYIDETTGKLLDAGVERTLISRPLGLSFQTASDILGDTLGPVAVSDPVVKKAKAVLGVVEKDLELWSEYRLGQSADARAREDRLRARETVDQEMYSSNTRNGASFPPKRRDDGSEGFQRTRGHRLVDNCLEIHGFALQLLLKRAKATVPYMAGRERDGRTATAPLRRFIDGMAQRQALAVFCDYGGAAMSRNECSEVGKSLSQTINAISNTKARKTSNVQVSSNQQKAARALIQQLTNSQSRKVPAMSTGKQSEVVLVGVGAKAKCKGIKGTLKPGKKVMVSIRHVDQMTGEISAVLLDSE